MQEYLQRLIAEKLKDARDTLSELSRKELLNLNEDDFTQRLLKKYRLDKPELKIDETNTELVPKKLTPHEMPGGTSFTFGQMFDVDVVIYKVPFFIPESLQSYMTGHPGSQILRRSLGSGKFLIFQYTEYQKITNEDVEKFKSSFQRDINYVKEYFEELEKVRDEINIQLEQPIRNYVVQALRNAQDEDGLENKLNPFT